jgi:hypothetical protein
VASRGSTKAPAGVRQADGTCAEHGQENRQHLAHVGRQEVAQEFADVVEDPSSLPHRRDDGGEVVVGQDHLAGFLGHLGTGDAHRNADVGRLHRHSLDQPDRRAALAASRPQHLDLHPHDHPFGSKDIHPRSALCVAQGESH